MYQGTLAAVSNRIDWIMDAEITNPADDSLVDLTGATINLYITKADIPWDSLISGSTTTGEIVITGTGTFTVTIPAAQMNILWPSTHRVFVRATIGGTEYQLLAGDLPVIEGGPIS